jgi:RNA polymerase sigma factor (sigma-70 family)
VQLAVELLCISPLRREKFAPFAQHGGRLRHQDDMEVRRAVGLTVGGHVTAGGVRPPSGQPSPIPASPSTDVLFAHERDALLRLAYLLTGNRAVAEDVVQDAFVQFHRKRADVRTAGAYLRTSVVNGARMHHRRAARERAHFADLVSLAVQPETIVVLDALGQLPHRQRAVLVLRYYEDRPDAVIAELLGCRPATVRSLARRGLAVLRKAMQE